MILMQTMQQTFKIEEIEKQDNLLEILSDKYCRAIIESITDKPKSVIEITDETKVPMSTVYRRVQTLHDSKLLATSGTITEDGKRLFLYKSKVKGIQSVFNNGKIEVELILNS
jgi:predicted transcriptional regulator